MTLHVLQIFSYMDEHLIRSNTEPGGCPRFSFLNPPASLIGKR